MGYIIDIHDSTKIDTSQRAERGLSGKVRAEVAEDRGVCGRGQYHYLTHTTAEVRSRRSRALRLAPPAQFGVPDIAQRIAKEIKAQDRQTDSQAGEDGEPGGALHKGTPGAAEHQPPGRLRRLRPQA